MILFCLFMITCQRFACLFEGFDFGIHGFMPIFLIFVLEHLGLDDEHVTIICLFIIELSHFFLIFITVYSTILLIKENFMHFFKF